MHKVIKILSYVIILLGIIHISFAFPLHKNTETLWFAGNGMAIIFAGLLNLLAIDRGGSKFRQAVAIIINALNCAGFCFALAVSNEPQVYTGIFLFLITTAAFIVELIQRQSAKL